MMHQRPSRAAVAAFVAVALSLASSASAAVVADFAADYAEPTPAAGWAYQWNPSGVNLNNPAGYDSLDFNAAIGFYDSDGAAGFPDAAPASFVLVDQGFVHPGQGQNQAGNEHAAITSFTLSQGGQVTLLNLSAQDQNTGGGSGAGVQVATFTGGVFTPVYSNTWPNAGGITEPSLALGNLPAGSRVIVAVVPNGDDGFDGTNLGYQIDVVVPEPASLSLLSLGVALLARRRKR